MERPGNKAKHIPCLLAHKFLPTEIFELQILFVILSEPSIECFRDKTCGNLMLISNLRVIEKLKGDAKIYKMLKEYLDMPGPFTTIIFL